jgi:hypothetical protein
MLIQMAQAIWIFVLNASSVRWLAFILLILTGLILLTLIYHAVFQCYTVFCEYGSTLRYLRGITEVDDVKSEEKVSKQKFLKSLIEPRK